MLAIVSGPVPVFFSTDDWDVLLVPTRCDPKARLDGVRRTAGAGAVPVPLTPRLCGLSDALSATRTVAEREPDAVGVKTTLIEQVAFTASVAGDSGQSVVGEKSPGFVPAIDTPVIASGAVPVFLSVELCEALGVPTSWLPRLRLAGVSETAGAGGAVAAAL
jgi:hypothetical protein